MKAREDRSGNYIGDGSYNVEYTVFDMPEGVEVRISKSDTSESVYVYYTYKEEKVTVRFSHHQNNAVKLGEQLDGNLCKRDEVLCRLGLKKRTFIPDTYLSISFTTVSKKNANNYEEAPLTIQEMYSLGEGADLTEYVGKLAKNSRYLITGNVVKKEIKTRLILGQNVQIGTYIYHD